MRIFNHSTVLTAAWLILFFAFPISSPIVAQQSEQEAANWTQWMGNGQDGVWHETGILKKFPEGGPEIKWRFDLGGGYAGPAVSDGRVFVMDRTNDDRGGEVENGIRDSGEIPGGERIVCLDSGSGQKIWEHQYDCPYNVAYPTGPRCTPTVDGEHVYTLGAMGDLICFKAETGAIVWQKNLLEVYETKPPLWGFASHPLIDGEQLLVPAGGDGSGVVSLNKLTGEENWRAVTTMDVCYAPLVIYKSEVETAPRQLIFWHADAVTSLNPDDGTEFWSVNFPEEVNPSQTAIATPRLSGDKLLISEFYKGSLLLQIESDPPGVNELWRSHKTDPKNKTALNSMMTTPLIKDGHAIGIAYNARAQGVFRCIDLESGEMKWTDSDWLEEGGVVFATAFIVTNGDREFLFCDNGELMIASLTVDGFEEIDRAKILEPTSVARGRKVVWSHPAFAERKMFARNDKEIVCVELAE